MKKNVLFLVFLSVFMLTKAQRFYLPEDVKHSTIRFNLVNNLIVVPVEVNGTSLSFILDTGVSRPILFNISEQDSVALSNLNPIKIQGLGSNGPVQAFRSTANKMRIGKAQNIYQDLFLVMDKDINLSPSLGVAVHGMIGFDLFRDFVVEINYSAKKLKLINRRHYRKKLCNSCEELPIEIYRNKAYVMATTSNLDRSNNVKLLIDTGSSDAIWLFADEALQLQVPQKSFEDFLGRGLSGNIFGFRGKYDYLHFGEFSLKEPVVSFPDRQYFLPMKNKIGRNGSVGGAVLRRFKIVFDYQSKHIILKKNTMFKKPFAYNVSGIELRHQG
ncbi:MAG: aspartyl protease family protein, partial [Flavobacteriaceae bacterium]|nr:aspartyl protease family protein [Flavobacteriaceae bacterium]